MNVSELNSFLYQETESERWHIAHPGELSHFYNSLEKRFYDQKEYYYFDFKNTLKTEMYGIVRETRYTVIPPHFHKDMELNYIYDGKCTFIINGKEITMEYGDVCILDSNVVHSATSLKGPNDIVINMIFQKAFFDYMFLNYMSNQGIVSDFLMNAIYKDQSHNHYVLFHAAENPRIHSIIQFLMCEYFSPGSCFHELMRLYSAALFIELGNTTYHFQGTNPEHRRVLPILKYIEDNHSHCTLSETAEHFGYNANYLSNYLKKETGKSFIQIKTSQQLMEGASLLRNTDLPITEIANMVGSGNITYFYKKFTDYYHKTPGEYRQDGRTVR